jgi:nucleotide-binding universal stress UspA family protein
MKNILVAVDETRGSLPAIETVAKLFQCIRPEKVVLLYVQKMEGRSLMDDVLLSDSEIKTLKEALNGTEYQEILNKKSEKVIEYFKKSLEEKGITGIKSIVKEGHPAEEILKTAQEEGVEMIIVGSRGKRLHNFFMGSVSREVANKSNVPVLIAR